MLPLSSFGERVGLTILCAGCSADERELAESEVRRALQGRTGAEAFRISLVKARESWSVTLEAPGAPALTFKAPVGRLGEAIREAVLGPAQAASSPSNPSGVGVASRAHATRHGCAHCHRPFTVTYDASPDEAEVTAPVACPHCWKINQVPIAESAAVTLDYKTESA